MIATDKNFTAETFRQLTTAFEPWINAAKAFTAESEKMQKLALENAAKAMDNGHKMAKEGLDAFAAMSVNVQKQVTAQVERTVELMGSLVPKA